MASPSNRLYRLRSILANEYNSSPRLFFLRLLYLICMVYVLIFWRAFWTPDLLFVMFFGLFLLYGKGRQFMVQFGPFVVLLLAYDSLRSFAPAVNHRVHFTEMIDFDRWIGFGTLPSETLQQLLFHGSIQWYDFYFYGLYMCHFITPLIIGVLIWRFRPAHYNRYVAALLMLSYAAFLTYIAFPAAPPWMASEMGLIPHLHKISTDVWYAVGVHNFPTIYKELSPNLVAAVPSLHSAYPVMICLFVGRAFGWRWGLAMLWYPISIWVGVVYMGEHYVFDVVAGVAYAVVAYGLTILIFRQYGTSVRRLQARAKQRYRRTVSGGTSETGRSAS